MYQFSRSMYRELGPLVVGDRYGSACVNRQHFLQACENAFQRLASDRHYFARPSRTLFNDVRFFFPMCEQVRVYRVVDRYMRVAAHFVDEREREGISLDGNPLSLPREHAQGHAVSAGAAAGQQVLPLAQAPGRALRNSRGRVGCRVGRRRRKAGSASLAELPYLVTTSLPFMPAKRCPATVQ